MIKQNYKVTHVSLLHEVYNVYTYINDTAIIIGAYFYFQDDKCYLSFDLTTRKDDIHAQIMICLGKTKAGRYRFSFVQLAEMLQAFRSVFGDASKVDDTFEKDYLSWKEYGLRDVRHILEYIYNKYSNDNDECWEYGVCEYSWKNIDGTSINIEEI